MTTDNTDNREKLYRARLNITEGIEAILDYVEALEKRIEALEEKLSAPTGGNIAAEIKRNSILTDPHAEEFADSGADGKGVETSWKPLEKESEEDFNEEESDGADLDEEIPDESLDYEIDDEEEEAMIQNSGKFKPEILNAADVLELENLAEKRDMKERNNPGGSETENSSEIEAESVEETIDMRKNGSGTERETSAEIVAEAEMEPVMETTAESETAAPDAEYEIYAAAKTATEAYTETATKTDDLAWNIDFESEHESEIKDEADLKPQTGYKIINEASRPDWYDWEVDYPASYVDDIYKAISFNDRYEFIKELFDIDNNLYHAEELYKETLDDINGITDFKSVVRYIRERFPMWDEQSDEVYRFYMAVRRKFNR